MSDEWIFKAILVISFLLMTIPRLIYVERQEKLRILEERDLDREERLSLVSTILWDVPLALYLFTNWLDPFQLPLPLEARWLGALILLIGGNWLFLKVHHYLGDNWSPYLQIREGHELVIDGPYRYVRHPMYTSFYFMAIGIFLVSANWMVGLTRIAVSILVQVVRLPHEEKMMLDNFGEAYRQYRERTGAFLPKLF